MPIGLKAIPPTGYSERENSDMVNQINQLSLSWGGETRSIGDQYYKNEIIRDGTYTMVAIRDTTDRPAPQPIGAIETDQPDVPAFTNPSNLSVVSSAHEYTLIKDGWLGAIQVWVPDVAISIVYRFIFISQLPDQTAPTINVVENPLLVAGQWNTLFASALGLLIGSKVTVVIEAVNVASRLTWDHPWLYEGTSQGLGPGLGGWNRTNQHDIVRISKTDDDSVDQSTDLGLIVVGTELRMADTANSSLFYLYVVDFIIDNITHFEYLVTPLSISGSGPTVGLQSTITADIPTAQATQYSTVVDWWVANQPSFANVVGALEFDGVPQAAGANDSFGIRIGFQEADVSPDWELVAFSG